MSQEIRNVIEPIMFLAYFITLIFATVGRCMIFSKKKSSGIIGIIPIYNIYFYGKITGRKVSAIMWSIMRYLNMIAIFNLAIIVVAGAFVGFAAMAGTFGIMLKGAAAIDSAGAVSSPDIEGFNSFIQSLFTGVNGVFASVLLIICITMTLKIIFRMIVMSKFVKMHKLSNLYILGWLFIPHITETILGFSKNNLDIENNVADAAEVEKVI